MIHSVTNLYIAYAATWVIHIGYLLFLGPKQRSCGRKPASSAPSSKTVISRSGF